MTDPKHDIIDFAAPDDPPVRTRKPGEVAFAVIVTVLSAVLLNSAYGISGFEALSAPGSVPMATTAVMLIASLIVLRKTLRRPKEEGMTFGKDILPLRVIILMAMLVAFGIAFTSLGFIPTTAIFLVIAMKFLAKRSWPQTLLVAFGSLVAIWLIFRVVFTVLLPAGIVPEAEMLQFFRNLF